MLVVVHCQWCRPIVRQTQNSRCTKWLLRSLRRRRSQWATERGGGGGEKGGTRGTGEAGTREIVRCDREKEVEIARERKIEGARESQWYQRMGIVYTELIKTSPFNTPFPLASSRTNTRTLYEIHTHILPK